MQGPEESGPTLYIHTYFLFSHNELLIHLKKYFDAFITGILLMNAMAQQRAHIFLCKYITWLYYFHSVVLRIPIVQRLYIYNSSKLPVI